MNSALQRDKLSVTIASEKTDRMIIDLAPIAH
jgi:hypothetical protein